jgi:hypothetical protein
MLKLLLLTLGTWSVLSLSLVGTLGFLLQLRHQRTYAMGASTGGANLRGAGGHTAMSKLARARAEREPMSSFGATGSLEIIFGCTSVVCCGTTLCAHE